MGQNRKGIDLIIATTAFELQSAMGDLKNKKWGFVPTMGALHPGHLSLVEHCQQTSDAVVLSIFVNPTQFGPTEDYLKYPRPLEQDLALARKANVDVVFLPTEQTFYPSPQTFFVDPGPLANVMCGKYRPGHFRGVCTVVLKLLETIQPHVMVLGQKDIQQLRLIQMMAEQLNLTVKIIGAPTHREPRGLALSSRNQYLSEVEKEKALVIYQTLEIAHNLVQQGEKNIEVILKKSLEHLKNEGTFELQYLEARDYNTLTMIECPQGPWFLAIAGYMGKTRLIDNIVFP